VSVSLFLSQDGDAGLAVLALLQRAGVAEVLALLRMSTDSFTVREQGWLARQCLKIARNAEARSVNANW
jgi:hypothetical protein